MTNTTTGTKGLTGAQSDALAYARDHAGKLFTGRNGVCSANTARALERRGLLTKVGEWTWETDWRLTDAGKAAASNLFWAEVSR